MRDPGRANKESREHNEMGEERQKLEREHRMGQKLKRNWKEMRETKFYNFQLEFPANCKMRN